MDVIALSRSLPTVSRVPPPFASERAFEPLTAPFVAPLEVERGSPGELTLRTRLQVELPLRHVLVHWQLASEPRFLRLERYGLRFLQAADEFALALPLAGLEPGRPYWARLWAGGCWSPVAHLWTESHESRPHPAVLRR